MVMIVGRPCRFSDCAAGDLLRITLGDGSAFAFALAAGQDAEVTTALVLSQEEITCEFIDAHETVLNYGKKFLFREDMGTDSVRPSGKFLSGALRVGYDNKSSYMTLLFSFDKKVRFYDVTTGRLGQRQGGTSLDITRWSLVLKTDDTTPPLTIFEKK